jgi:hypothetical protein
MTRGKRAKLVRSGPQDRTTEREPVAIPATCKIGERDDENVLVIDLGIHGCKIHTGAVGVTKTENLVLNLEGCAPIKGSLKWSKGGQLGVRFAKPLDEKLLAMLCTEQSVQNVVPLRS